MQRRGSVASVAEKVVYYAESSSSWLNEPHVKTQTRDRQRMGQTTLSIPLSMRWKGGANGD